MRFGVKASTQIPAQWVEQAQQTPPGFASFTLDCPYPFSEIPALTVKALRDVRVQRGLTYFVHTPALKIALGDTDPTARDGSIVQVQRAIFLASQVGAELITVHPVPCPDADRDTWEQREQLQRDALIALCPDAQARGVVIAIENMPPRNVYSPGYSDLSSLFALKSIRELGITLDVGHANMAGISLRDAVLRLDRRLRHVHVHDNDGSADQHRPVGSGTVDWLELMRALAQIGYAGVMEFEFQGEAHLRASKKHLESLL
ncbi:MAG: sugar phosphate isomerase/epimerase [Chloroflexi bacterium]|nr:sugar phosphate isomerase/epimerase [Chloroflexota bacterium]